MTAPTSGAVAEFPWLLLQMTDSACPTGGFAQSYGVEELWVGGDIASPDELLGAIRTYVAESLAGRELVFVALGWDGGHRWATRDDGQGRDSEAALDGLSDLARHHLTTRLSRATRDAERSRGRALQRALDAMHGPSPVWAASEASYAVLFGAAAAVFGASRMSALRAGAHSHVSAMTQAAVRLGRIGPLAGQEILGRSAGPVEAAVRDSAGRRFGDWYGFAPEWELAQTRCEHNPYRMFAT